MAQQRADTRIYLGEGRTAQQHNMFALSEVRLFDDDERIETVRFPYLSSLPLRSLFRTPARQQPLAGGHGMVVTPWMPHYRAWTQSVSLSLYIISPLFLCYLHIPFVSLLLHGSQKLLLSTSRRQIVQHEAAEPGKKRV